MRPKGQENQIEHSVQILQKLLADGANEMSKRAQTIDVIVEDLKRALKSINTLDWEQLQQSKHVSKKVSLYPEANASEIRTLKAEIERLNKLLRACTQSSEVCFQSNAFLKL